MKASLTLLLLLATIIGIPDVSASLNLVRERSEFEGLPEDYESWTAAEKFSFWNETLTTEAASRDGKSAAAAGGFPGILEQIQFLTTDEFSHTFERVRDDLPYTHAKRIRSVGGIGLVTWHPTSEPHPYTGYFATGTPHALIRLSYTSPNDESGTSPGLSLKIFRDGMPSSNMLAMESLEGQSSGNFFEFDFSNHLPPAKTPLTKYVSRRFSRYSCPSTKTGLSEIATSNEAVRQMYSSRPNIEFPYRVVFKPNPVLTERFKDYPPAGSLFDILSVIEVGTILYDIYAVTDPEDGTEMELHVGHLELTKQIQPSVIGDRMLFFRHQKIEEDYQMKPEFKVQANDAPRCPAGYA